MNTINFSFGNKILDNDYIFIIINNKYDITYLQPL